MPQNLMWLVTDGPTDTGCSRWIDRLGLPPIFTGRGRAIQPGKRRCVIGWHVCEARRRASPPCQPISHGRLPGCMARPRPVRLGGWPSSDRDHPLASICRTTSPTRSSSGASSDDPTPSSPIAPDQRRRQRWGEFRSFTLHQEQIIRWSGIYRNIAELTGRRAADLAVELYNAQCDASKRTAT